MMISKFVTRNLNLLVVVFLLFRRSGSSDEVNDIPDEIGGLSFSYELNNRLAQLKENNWCFSPFAVRVALAMIYESAQNDTASQLEAVLQLNDFQSTIEMHRVFQACLNSLFPNPLLQLFLANRLYVRQGYPIDPAINTTINTYYKSSAENIDFRTDPNEATARINLWMEHEMSDRFKDFILPGSLSPDAGMVLVNGIYFKGRWKTRFDPAHTKIRPFVTPNGIVQVPTMYVKSIFKYAYSTVMKCHVLELPYDGDRLVMHIILHENVETFLIQLNHELVNTYVHKFNSQEVEVYLPKFTSSFKTEMHKPLKSLGIVDAFNENAYLLVSAKEPRLGLTSVVHQAVVVVDEEGAVDATKRPQLAMTPIEFRVNHSCIFMIYDLKFKHILFMGQITELKY